jgi:broad specificity phosphatase PhoE
MTVIHLVRHGRAAAGWDTDPDPDLDEVGRTQAADAVEALIARQGDAGPTRTVVSSPLLRCRSTASFYAAQVGANVRIEPRVAEIPSPEGVVMAERVAWLRAAMAGTWADLGARYVDFRDQLVAAVAAMDDPDGGHVVVMSHFIAINAVIGACCGDDSLVIRSLDNCSITTVESTPAGLTLLDAGHEADTLIR